ncbi:MAG: phosphotransferase [Propionibacteriaceae bacterium]
MLIPDDGAELLTNSAVGELLEAAVENAGGSLREWSLDHLDVDPGQVTTATYAARVDWGHSCRKELLGVRARAHGLLKNDERAAVFSDGEREVAVWIYPHDPELLGLARATYPEEIAELLTAAQIFPQKVSPRDVQLEIVNYLPCRRAVLRVTVSQLKQLPVIYYLKVLSEDSFVQVQQRHEMLRAAGIPVPTLIASLAVDSLLLMEALPGASLAETIFGSGIPCRAEDLIELLDLLPSAASELQRRPSWVESIAHYGNIVAQAMPDTQFRINRLVNCIQQGLSDVVEGTEPTHGDFHEGQVHVLNGQISGLLDIDTLGPGHRADDLACLLAHLSTVHRMNRTHALRLRQTIDAWVPVFDDRVDPIELRLRTAAVVVSLATGPFRFQSRKWQDETLRMIELSERLVKQVW